MSTDLKNPFAMPGDSKLKKSDLNSSAPKDIFQQPKGGGIAPRRKPETNQDPEEELLPENTPPPPPKETPVRLSNPKWSVDSAYFEETVSLSVDVDLPESLKDITRVIVTVFAFIAHEKKQQVKSLDLHVKDGKVQSDFDIPSPEKRENKEIDSCSYLFTAKHRDSKEVESPRLSVKSKSKGNDELVLELPSSDELKKNGHTFQLMSKDGTIVWKVETKNGVEKDGKLTLKFENLDPNLEYSLDELNGKGQIIETLFTNTPFGKWAEDVK